MEMYFPNLKIIIAGIILKNILNVIKEDNDENKARWNIIRDDITRVQVADAVKKRMEKKLKKKKEKSTGVDIIPAEPFTPAGEMEMETLVQIINQVWKEVKNT